MRLSVVTWPIPYSSATACVTCERVVNGVLGMTELLLDRLVAENYEG